MKCDRKDSRSSLKDGMPQDACILRLVGRDRRARRLPSFAQRPLHNRNATP